MSVRIAGSPLSWAVSDADRGMTACTTPAHGQAWLQHDGQFATDRFEYDGLRGDGRQDVREYGRCRCVRSCGPVRHEVGGNQFHGRFIEVVQHERFASENIDDRLRAQGIVVSDSVVWYNDLAADLGGRLIRDKLWFYGNLRDERSKI